MYTKEKVINIEGKQVKANLQFFDRSDLSNLKDLYWSWVNLSNSSQNLGGRRINLPEIISEAIYCINFNSARLNSSVSGINTSFDCFNLDKQKRIQVKACSVKEDLTSFGPRSVWDEIYFIHFFPNNKYDGSYSIYKIENELIYNHNVSKTESFKDQQKKGIRPRFSIIKKIIKPKAMKPILESTL
jgi:hypothetical protein